MTPLNLFLRDAERGAAREAVIDYGNAIKDLAAADIFTGDMLLKNFGVTRHGRVICYDYDELCLLSECRFRRIPEATSLEEEFAAEPWFHRGGAGRVSRGVHAPSWFRPGACGRPSSRHMGICSTSSSGRECSGGWPRARWWTSFPTARCSGGSSLAATSP